MTLTTVVYKCLSMWKNQPAPNLVMASKFDIKLSGLQTYLFVLMFLLTADLCTSQTYNNTKAIFDDKLNTANYNKNVRPLEDQSVPIYVNVSFYAVSIVDVNEVSQTFMCNGIMQLSW